MGRNETRRHPAAAAFTGEQVQRLLLAAAAFEASIGKAVAEAGGDPDLCRSPLPVTALAALALSGPTRPRDLSAQLGVRSVAMARLLDRLEGLGFVERSYGQVAGDRRAVIVTLTEAGRSFTDAACDALGRRLLSAERLASHLSSLLGQRAARAG